MECLFGVVITEAKAAEVSCFVSGSYAQVTCSDKDKRTKHGLKVKDKLGPIYKSKFLRFVIDHLEWLQNNYYRKDTSFVSEFIIVVVRVIH